MCYDDRKDCLCAFAVVSLGITIFISCFLIGFSFIIITPLYYGVLIDTTAQQVDTSELFGSGRHFVGLGKSFLQFPQNQQLIIFSDKIMDEKTNMAGASSFDEDSSFHSSIRARTSEGLLVDISLFFGYYLTNNDDDRVKVEQLWEIYQRFEMDWDAFLVIIVSAEIRDIASMYNAEDFYSKRAELGETLFQQLVAFLDEHFIKLSLAVIVNVEFPAAYDEACQQIEIIKQNIKEKEYEKYAVQTDAETGIIVAELSNEIAQETAESIAYADKLRKYAEADALIQDLSIQEEALIIIKNNLFDGEADPQEYILNYLWIYALIYNQAGSVTFSTSFPDLS